MSPLIRCCLQQPKKLNIRCNPADVLETIKLMNTDQLAEVANYRFAALVDMALDAVECRGLLRWLMDHTDPRDMTIRAGPGKELKITKEVVKLVLGIPSSGGSIQNFGWAQRKQVASNFRASIGIGNRPIKVEFLRQRVAAGGVDQLTMRCFFLIVMNRLLFPSASWNITNSDIVMTEHMDRMAQIDWCQLVYNHLCDSVQKWHQEKPKAATRTIYGCSVVILVSFLYRYDYWFTCFYAITLHLDIWHHMTFMHTAYIIYDIHIHSNCFVLP